LNVDFGLVSSGFVATTGESIVLRFSASRDAVFRTSKGRPSCEGIQPPFHPTDAALHTGQLSLRASAESGEIRSTQRCA
jgi:hypothetical protein